MKKKLNLICFLLFCALGLSLSLSIFSGVEGTNEAWQVIRKDEAQSGEQSKPVTADLYTIVRLTPSVPGSYPDSLFNEKTNNWIPVQYNEIITRGEKRFSKGELVGLLLLLLCSLGAMVMAFVYFIKLIRNINRLKIFEWANVRNLKRLGWAFLILFFINVLLGYLNYSAILQQLSIRGYNIDWSSSIQTTYLIIGLAALLVAEIFAIGLRLKEEQELTI